VQLAGLNIIDKGLQLNVIRFDKAIFQSVRIAVDRLAALRICTADGSGRRAIPVSTTSHWMS
jgi:hypothetical protein